jgi:hypothetical protein
MDCKYGACATWCANLYLSLMSIMVLVFKLLKVKQNQQSW